MCTYQLGILVFLVSMQVYDRFDQRFDRRLGARQVWAALNASAALSGYLAQYTDGSLHTPVRIW